MSTEQGPEDWPGMREDLARADAYSEEQPEQEPSAADIAALDALEADYQRELAEGAKALTTNDISVCSACAALIPGSQIALDMHAAWHRRLVSVLKMADHLGTSKVLMDGPL